MNQLTGTHSRRNYAPRRWAPQIRFAVVVAACLIVEAIVVKNILDVKANIVALLAPLWVFALSQAWPTKERAFQLAAMILAIGAAAGVLVFYAL